MYGTVVLKMGFPGGSGVKNLPANEGDAGSMPGSGRSHRWGNATCSTIFTWRIPWTEEPGGLQSMRSKRAGHNWATEQQYQSSENGVFLLPVFQEAWCLVPPKRKARLPWRGPRWCGSGRQGSSSARSLPPACFQLDSHPCSCPAHLPLPEKRPALSPLYSLCIFSCLIIRAGTHSWGSYSLGSQESVLTLLTGTDTPGSPFPKPATVLTVRGPSGKSDRGSFPGLGGGQAVLLWGPFIRQDRNWRHPLLGHQEAEQTQGPPPGCPCSQVCWSWFSSDFCRSFFVFLKSF